MVAHFGSLAISDHVLSVYPTNPTLNNSTACGCHPTSITFHPAPRFSVPMPHLISTPRCHCLTYCFDSFLQLLRRRSHVRIVLGRPNTRLADEISEEFIRYGRFRPGPPRNTKTTFGWFFHLGICYKLAIYQWSRYVQLL